MGVCSFGHKSAVVVPVLIPNEVSQDRNNALRLKLWNMKRIDEAPALAISTSKMYQMRKNRQEQIRARTTSPESEALSSHVAA